MKTTRFITASIAAADSCTTEMPWTRGRRRAAFIARRKAAIAARIKAHAQA